MNRWFYTTLLVPCSCCCSTVSKPTRSEAAGGISVLRAAREGGRRGAGSFFFFSRRRGDSCRATVHSRARGASITRHSRASCVPSCSVSCSRRWRRTPPRPSSPRPSPPVDWMGKRGERRGVVRKKSFGPKKSRGQSQQWTFRRTRGPLRIRTLAAFLAAFFSCFSRSTAAMISICVGGRFSRFCAFPLFRMPTPNSTPC